MENQKFELSKDELHVLKIILSEKINEKNREIDFMKALWTKLFMER